MRISCGGGEQLSFAPRCRTPSFAYKKTMISAADPSSDERVSVRQPARLVEIRTPSGDTLLGNEFLRGRLRGAAAPLGEATIYVRATRKSYRIKRW